MVNRDGGGHRIKRPYLLACFLVFLFSMPLLSDAATPLYDEPPGTIITFSGQEFMILEQKLDGTTYIILNSNDGNRAFDPNGTNIFDPSDSNNIGYYLNNTYYNSLSQNDLIETHSWDLKNQLGTGTQADVICEIALISHAEFQSYSYLFPPKGRGYAWWTRTPHSAYTNYAYYVSANSNTLAMGSVTLSRGLHPTLYLKPGILIDENNIVIGYVAPPATPNSLEALAISHNQVQLTWNANTESDLAGYNIYRDYVEIARIGPGEISYIDSELQPNTQYIYGIEAYNTSLMTSGMSNAATVTTLLPPAPSELTVNDITPTGANAAWAAVAGADSYNIYLNGTPIYNTTQTQYGITGLSPGTSHTIEIRTVISGVESNPGSSESFTTISTPAAPTGLSITSVTSNQVQLSWNNNKEPELAGYIVYRNQTEVASVGNTSTGYTDSGLKPNTTYNYGIKAYNTFGLVSDMSNAVSVRTESLPNSIKTPSAAVMINDVKDASSKVLYPLGGLIALGLGIKLCPWLITIAKTIFLR